MSPTSPERLATLEQQIGELRRDVQALTLEQERTRKRLHTLEGTTSGLVQAAKIRAQVAEDSSRRQTRWLQVLTLVVGVAGVIGPLVYSGIGH